MKQLPRFHSLWSINGALDRARLCQQLDALREAGLDGVVFHPRFYPNEPPYLGARYLAEVSATILHAKEIGLAFWLYDENGWPSGTVGGELLRRFPTDRQQWAELVTEPPGDCLRSFERHGRRWFVARRKGPGVDYLNADVARHFLAMTHERYRDGLAPAAWEHVEAIFCDEPEFGLGHVHHLLSPHGAIPWTPRLPELYRARHGEDLIAALPEIFHSGNDDRESETRAGFWELLSDVFAESFLVPIDAWCRRHGKRFTTHIKGEEHPLFQVPMVGSCARVFRKIALPGIDALERFPSNEFFPRQVASAAAQFGDGRCMVEAFGGSGWGASPEDLERYLLWLGRNGLTDFVLHLSQYRLDSAAIRDWPPSQPLHVNWHEAFPEILRRVRAELQRSPVAQADTLLIAPYRGIAARYEPRELLETNIHNAATYPHSTAAQINRAFMERVRELQAGGAAWHVTDERTFEDEGRVDANGALHLGKCRYAKVVAADGVRLSPAGIRLLAETRNVPFTSNPAPVVVKDDDRRESCIVVAWDSFPPINSMLLEVEAVERGTFVCRFACKDPEEITAHVFFADDIEAVRINGAAIFSQPVEDGTLARLPREELRLLNELHFERRETGAPPQLWLRGDFCVASCSAFADGPNGTIATAGPFVVCAPRVPDHRDLVHHGFPFLRSPWIAETTLRIAVPARRLRLIDVAADAARFFLPDGSSAWTWGPDWSCTLDHPLAVGAHRVRIELIPSTYNFFGPHRCYRGDAPVVSPDQFRGVRNFADPSDAPENTLVALWHFKPLRLPSAIGVG